jgi:Tfp pilus assembly protein PilF/FixJ family two-component response regulator
MSQDDRVFDPGVTDFKVLIAEPQEHLRKTIREMLGQQGFKSVMDVKNGTEAWTTLKHSKVDVLLAAWDMPEISGMALLKVIRTESRLDSLPVILMCQEVTKGQVVEAGEAGVSDILLLPLTPATLSHKLEEALLAGRDPQFLEAEKHYHLGLELMRKQRYSEALEEFQRILSVYESAEVYYNMGYICTAQNRWEEALRYFRKATQINQTFARAYRKMGEVYSLLGRKKLAEQSYQQAAEIYLEKQMDDNAEMVLNEVLKINPNTINVYNSLGIIYRRRGHYDEALNQYQKAIKVNPDNENIYYNMGRIFFDTQRYEQAQKTLEKALEINPDFAEAKDLLGSVMLNLGKR